MARWALILLLLCNAIYFAWQQMAAPQAAADQRAAEARAPRGGDKLRLLAEVSNLQPRRRAAPVEAAPPGPVEDPVRQPPAPAEPESNVCNMIGPFREKLSAGVVRNRLDALDIDVELRQLNIPGDPDYWVHIAPMVSKKEAIKLLRELQAKKIDSFLITDGELANGISLGFFTREELARKVLEKRVNQGYNAQIKEVPRSHSEVWVVFEPGEIDKFSPALWEKIQEGNKGLELRKNYCDMIASAEKLD